jgi:hypothetical protein
MINLQKYNIRIVCELGIIQDVNFILLMMVNKNYNTFQEEFNKCYH